MEFLWTFESNEKAEPLIISLQNKAIAFELQSKGKQGKGGGDVSIYVSEEDYVVAKKLLMKHRKRKPTA